MAKPDRGGAATRTKAAANGSAKQRPLSGSKPRDKTPTRQTAGAGGAPNGQLSHQGGPSLMGTKPGKPISKKEHKELVVAKKLALKKNFPLIQEMVSMWEKSRPKAMSKSECEALVSKLFVKVRGKVVELANNHSGSRVIQFCAKNGNEKDRADIMLEVRNNMVELSKSKFAHHLVRKLINVSKREEVTGILKPFRGHIAELLRHPHGADVIMDLYDVASSAQRNAMCAEFYGREFVVFEQQGDAAPTSLKQLLAQAEARKRRTIFQHMSRAVIPIMEKALLHPPLTHRLLREFLEQAPGMSVEDAVDTLAQTGGSVLKMVHTHDGAAVACMLLAYASAKGRKQIIKGMKGFVKDMAMNEWGHAVLCTAVSVTDDTELVRKGILAELKDDLEALLVSKFSRSVFLQILSPDNHRYFPPHVLQMMHPATRTVKGAAGAEAEDAEEAEGLGAAADGEDDGGELLQVKKKRKKGGAASPAAKKRKAEAAEAEEAAGPDMEGDDAAPSTTGGEVQDRVLGESKKDPMVRRRELLGSGPSGLGQRITELCAARAGGMLRSATAADMVVEVCRGGDGGLLAECAGAAVEQLHDRIAAEAARPADDPSGDAAEEVGPAPRTMHVLLDWYGSRALRRLLLASAEDGPAGACATNFARKLWSQALRGRCQQWMGSHAEKVLAALVRCGAEDVRQEASKELQKLVKVPLQEWAQSFLGQRDAAAGAAGGEEAQAKAGASPRRPKNKRGHAAAADTAPHSTAGEEEAVVHVAAEAGGAGAAASGRKKQRADAGGKSTTVLAVAAGAAQQQQQQPKAETGTSAGSKTRAAATPGGKSTVLAVAAGATQQQQPKAEAETPATKTKAAATPGGKSTVRAAAAGATQQQQPKVEAGTPASKTKAAATPSGKGKQKSHSKSK